MDEQPVPVEVSKIKDEETLWRDSLPPALQPVAERHGRELFLIVMGAGAVGHALGIVQQHGMKNRAIMQALQVISTRSDFICQSLLRARNFQLAQFVECRGDIDRVAALMDSGVRAPGERVSSSGIILDS